MAGLFLLIFGVGCTVLALVLTGAGVTAATRANLTEARHMRDTTPLDLLVLRRSDHGPFVRLILARRRPRLGRLPGYRAGDYLTLLATPEGGRLARRCYSLAGWQARPNHYELLIKREAGGIVSTWVHQTLRVGSHLQALPPRGAFHLTRQSGERILIAGGVGITPLRSMLLRSLAQYRPPLITLLWSVRDVQELSAYHNDLLTLAARYPTLRYVPILTGTETPEGWSGLTGRLTAATILNQRQSTGRLGGLWICASTTMTEALTADLKTAGVDPEAIHSELFGAVVAACAETHQITVSGHNTPFAYLGEPTLLHCLERHNIPVRADCRGGHCGACRARLVSGQVATVLPPQVAVHGDEVLLCCVRPSSDIALAP